MTDELMKFKYLYDYLMDRQRRAARGQRLECAKEQPTTTMTTTVTRAVAEGATAADGGNGTFLASAGLQTPGRNDVGCRGLRSKRYVSDGFCRTLKPISEVLCTGFCVPERYLPWYSEFMQTWGRAKVMEYRCVDGVVRQQRIKLVCDNGKVRVYKVKVVKSCACRKQVRHHNRQEEFVDESKLADGNWFLSGTLGPPQQKDRRGRRRHSSAPPPTTTPNA